MNTVSQSELERRLEMCAALLFSMGNGHRLRVLIILSQRELQ
jgi:hypothetical protein